jgi:asparagine synthase (glutamine-hydrolysing)
VAEELTGLLEESVKLRFRADVPVGICLSGGVDSSLLLGLVHRIQGPRSEVQAFSFRFDHPEYDETPWVRMALENTRHPWHVCPVAPQDVPRLVTDVQRFQDEPFGGFPTLGMHEVHRSALREGVTVLLDGNGIDEAWSGYDYYRRAGAVDHTRGPVQGTGGEPPPDSFLLPDFASLADTPEPPLGGDRLRALQYRDLRTAKIPRALRFNDRVSMMFSRELREPFLDHRIVELGLRQPASRKIRHGQGKWLVREVARRIMPRGLVEAPKRPVQTPQREWLRGELADWAESSIEGALEGWGRKWLDAGKVRSFWESYRRRGGESSFPLWQWISINQVQRSCA